jgi:hypothetical protein
MNKFVILTILFLLSACATRGHKFDMADVDAMQPPEFDTK